MTYADLEHAPAVLLVGFEPEEESPIVFLRLRKAARDARPRSVVDRAVRVARPAQADGTLIPTRARRRGRRRSTRARRQRRSDAPTLALPTARVILVGERLATVPGALDRRRRLAARPRRTRSPGSRAGRRARRAREPAPSAAAARRPPVADQPPRRPESPTSGRRRAARAPARDTAGIIAAARGDRSTRSSSAASTPATSPTRGSRRPCQGLRRLPRDARVRVTEPPTSSCRSRRRPRSPAPSSTGRAGPRPFEAALTTNAISDSPGPGHARRRDGGLPRDPHPGADPRPVRRARRPGPASARCVTDWPTPPAPGPRRPNGRFVLATWPTLLDQGRTPPGR